MHNRLTRILTTTSRPPLHWRPQTVGSLIRQFHGTPPIKAELVFRISV